MRINKYPRHNPGLGLGTMFGEGGQRTVLNRDDAAVKIRDHLARSVLFSDEQFPFADDMSFIESGIVDSFGIVELLHFVEDEFHVAVADHELVPDNFDSVSKLSAFIVGKQGGSA